MTPLTIILLVYVFLTFYFLFLFTLIFIQNKSEVLYCPTPKKEYTLSIVVPCFNEQESVGSTIDTLANMNYKGLKKIIVVDDKSTDNSYNVIKQYEKKYPGLVKAEQTPHNSGCAAGAKNHGAKFVDTELISFTDADSYPKSDALDYMVGWFNDPQVGAVTSTVLVKNRNKFIEKVQAVEYKVIKFTRKLLEFIDSIYVTPGPLAVYRKSSFDDIGGFDEENLTEDIEITWHMQAAGYKVKMAMPARVYSIVPTTVKSWVKQRNRWNIGGIQTILKYKGTIARYGMLGAFILPFFFFSWVISIFGIIVLAYRLYDIISVRILSAIYSAQNQTDIIRFNELNLSLDILTFFGIVVISFTLIYTIIALSQLKEPEYKRTGIHTLAFYFFFYVLMYPIILISSIYKFTVRQLKGGKHSW